MEDKMVSIVLPTYNGLEYIKESITSVLKQDYKNWELIIVDDYSVDGTGEYLDSIALEDERIRVIHNLENKKLPASLNVGFSFAKGDYFTWTSDDNRFASNAIKELVAFLDENREIDIVYADYEIINAEGKIVNEVVHNSVSNIYQDNIVGACFMYRKKVQQDLMGYDESLFLVEDYDFWLRAYERFNFKCLQKKLYFYRIHENSLTTTRMRLISEKTSNLLQNVLMRNALTSEADKIAILKRIIQISYNIGDYRTMRKYMMVLRKQSYNEYKIEYKKIDIKKRIHLYFPI